MKVFYRINDVEYEFANEITNDLANDFIVTYFQKMKYRAMWELRHLENEINQSGGIIIVTKKGFETKQFPESLSKKIKDVLSSVDWEKW